VSDLRTAAQQALEALEEATNYTGCEAWSPSMTDECLAVAVALKAALEQPEQEPVACFIGTNGSAFDLPTTKRAYTYAEQPGNVASSKLGRALETARRCSAGDNIDAGLVLLKALQAEGFGVFQLGAEYTHPPRREWQGLTDDEKADIMFELAAAGSYMDCAHAIEAALRSKNYD